MPKSEIVQNPNDLNITITLPDRSRVRLNQKTFRFQRAELPPTISLQANAAEEAAKKNFAERQINFKKLAKSLRQPSHRFADCFHRISDHPRYSPKQSVYQFDVRFLTRLYKFPGSYQGGTFSSSETEWRFLDGGIISHHGYGWGSHSWTVVQGAEALRAVCMFFGIQQPLRIRGEPTRRPLSVLLEEMTNTPVDFTVPAHEHE
jgi:hypothetical protein